MTPKRLDRLRLAALAVSLSVTGSSCGTVSSLQRAVEVSGQGSIEVALTLRSDVVFDPIMYEITGPTTKSGAISTAETGNTFTIDGLEPGGGYSIRLQGKLPNVPARCSGSAQFSVTAKSTRAVNVDITCSVIDVINGTANICAVIDRATGTPQGDGSVHQLAAAVSDEDRLPMNVIRYTWTAPCGSGTFDRPTTADPKFTCAVDGPVKLTLNADDTDCGDKKVVDVTCKKRGTPVAGSGADACADAAGAAASGSDTCRSCAVQDPVCREGACKPEIEAAAESTEPADIAQR